MAPSIFSYTKTVHSTTYPAISPSRPSLSTAGKVVAIVCASDEIARATALAFAVSHPKAIILLGQRASTDVLAQIAREVRNVHGDIKTRAFGTELANVTSVRNVFGKIATDLGSIDILFHCVGVNGPAEHLLQAAPETLLVICQTNVVRTLVVAQAIVLANRVAGVHDKPITFVNLTPMGTLGPSIPQLAATYLSEIAVFTLLESFANENPQFRFYSVHPGKVAQPFGGEDTPGLAPGLVDREFLTVAQNLDGLLAN